MKQKVKTSKNILNVEAPKYEISCFKLGDVQGIYKGKNYTAIIGKDGIHSCVFCEGKKLSGITSFSIHVTTNRLTEFIVTQLEF